MLESELSAGGRSGRSQDPVKGKTPEARAQHNPIASPPVVAKRVTRQREISPASHTRVASHGCRMLDEPLPDASEEPIIDTRSLLGGYHIVNMENVYEMLGSFRDAAAVDDLYDEMWDDLTHNMLCARPSRRNMSISSFRKELAQLAQDNPLHAGAGFDAVQLKGVGFAATQLKGAGFDAPQPKRAGFGATQLEDAGFHADQLKGAGFDATLLKGAGSNAAQLKGQCWG
eukprot:g1861.t1